LNPLSHPDKVFWPGQGYTKQDLADFYEAIFPKLKPYVHNRMLTMERTPDGMLGQSFYQKEAPKGLPKNTPTKTIHHSNRDVNYILGGSLDTQLAMVNLGSIPIHVWGSRADKERQPDWMVFDLDPSDSTFASAAKAGLLVKESLDHLGLISFPKTSGSRGLHIFVPLKRGPDFDEILTFSRTLCDRLAAAHPDRLTVEARIQNRRDRVYLDSMRNGFGATIVSPYSVRRREKAPYSMPLTWKEVKPTLDPTIFNLGNYQMRLTTPDPWQGFFEARQSIQSAAKSLDKI
jgi:bifunctional non-homologous end joining protein LigD